MGEAVRLAVGMEPEIEINSRSGRIVVRAEGREDILVEDGAEQLNVERDPGGRLRLSAGRVGSHRLELRCPEGTPLIIGTASGAIELHGILGAVRITTSNGRVDAESVAAADIRSSSGAVTIGDCRGFCRAQTKSARIEIGTCGRLEAATHSGQIEVGRASGPVRMRSASGRIEVGLDGAQDVAVETMSGAVTVKLPQSVRPRARVRSLSGRPRVECAEGEDCRIAVQTMSGNIAVVAG